MTKDYKTYLSKLRSLVRNLLRSGRADEDLDEEIRTYVEMLADEKQEHGLAQEEARRAASVEVGGIEQIKEQVRDTRAGAWISTVFRDLRYGVRILRNSPGFAAVTVITLALCIGANTALFSVVHSLLLRALPYADADRLVYVSEYWPHEPPFRVAVSPDYANWRDNAKMFAGIEAYNRSGSGGVVHLTGSGEAMRLNGAGVTAGFFDLMGIRPIAGRAFLPEECRPGASPVVMLTHKLWRDLFHSSPEAISKTILLNGGSHVVVGVLPPSFVFPDNELAPDLFTPLTLPANPSWHDDENSFQVLRVLARLKVDVAPDTGAAELTGIARSTASIEPIQFKNMRRDLKVRVTLLRDRLVGNLRQLLVILQAAVGIVLLIGCLNIANLQIARSVIREKEIALRAALGAGRGRLARQLLTENLLLGVLGGVGGLALGYGCLPLLRAFMPAQVGMLETVRIDTAVLGFTLVITLLASLLTQLAPLRAALRAALRVGESSGRTTLPKGQQRLRGALVVAQVSLAVILVSASGLLIRAFVKLANVEPGFEPRGVLTLRVSLRGEKYAEPQGQREFATALLQRAQAMPGVQSAAIAEGGPVLGSRGAVGTAVEGRPLPPPGSAPTIPYLPVSQSYFDLLGIPLVRGRAFSRDDRENSPRTAIISEVFASEFFPFQDPIGKQIKAGRDWREVVGVARDVPQPNTSGAAQPQIYAPLAQQPIADLVLLLKSSRPADALIEEARALVQTTDPDQPVHDVATMQQRLSGALSAPRSNTILMGLLGSVALALAVIGLVGLLSHIVTQRTREIGIRMALGALKRDVVTAVLRQGLALTAVGVTIGLIAVPALTRTLDIQLPGVNGIDPATLAAVAFLFIVVATAACYIPAARAARVDPMTTLRHE